MGSLNCPSMITVCSGRVYSAAKDPELGLAVTKAFNDWVYECWWQPYPDRIIPLGITYLADPEHAAAEVRRNAERGFRSLTLPERPHGIGLPSIFTDYWDSVLAACQETGTVISLHVGSSGLPSDFASEAKSAGLSASLCGQLPLTACAEWIWSAVPARFPDLRIGLSEGGIGWMAMLLDRLETIVEHSGYGQDYPGDLTPAEEFLVLHDRRPEDHRHQRGHWGREDHG
jgi:predicted TIM-barrel fold metal-dependent hydrolase